MERKVYVSYEAGTFEFYPAPEGQLDKDIRSYLSVEQFEQLPTIDNEAVVERYTKASQEFDAARVELRKNIVPTARKENVPPICLTCCYYLDSPTDCSAEVVPNDDGTCKCFEKDAYYV